MVGCVAGLSLVLGRIFRIGQLSDDFIELLIQVNGLVQGCEGLRNVSALTLDFVRSDSREVLRHGESGIWVGTGVIGSQTRLQKGGKEQMSTGNRDQPGLWIVKIL